jgi:hypothetical protein
MSLLTHVAQYFTSTWRETDESHPEGVELAEVRFVSDFLEPFESSLGPFFGSDEEALNVLCSRSSGTLRLTIPSGNNNNGMLQSQSNWSPWRVGVSTAVGESSIDLGSNDLALTFNTGDVNIPRARSEIGPVLVGASYDYSDQAAAATLKVGPLATKISFMPSLSASPSVLPGLGAVTGRTQQPRPFLTRYNIVSEFSSFFPGGQVSQLPNLRIGVRTSNDPEEAPVVLGCALWPNTHSSTSTTPKWKGSEWSLAAVLSLTSLIHMQCHEHSGVIANYLSSARGLPGSRRDHQDIREDDEISVAGHRRLFDDGSLTASWFVRAPIGPRLFEPGHEWQRYAANEVDAKFALAAKTTIAQFPAVLSVAAHRSGVLCGGVELSLPSIATGLGVMWDADTQRLKFGFEVSG